MQTATPSDTFSRVWPCLSAPARWNTIDFISDLHLHDGDLPTLAAWQTYMVQTRADAVFILGDLFEVWIGDDLCHAATTQSSSCAARCGRTLAQAARRMSVYFLHGNRDFLLGDEFAHAVGMTLLSDPTTLVFAQQRYLLTHGDALCLSDTAYQTFRAQVRSPAWCADFLARPLPERQQLASAMRAKSDALKSSQRPWVDIDTPAACQWLQRAQASTLIHGHTHQPTQQALPCSEDQPRQRLVLGDWDQRAAEPRLSIWRLRRDQPPQHITQPSGF